MDSNAGFTDSGGNLRCAPEKTKKGRVYKEKDENYTSQFETFPSGCLTWHSD